MTERPGVLTLAGEGGSPQPPQRAGCLPLRGPGRWARRAGQMTGGLLMRRASGDLGPDPRDETTTSRRPPHAEMTIRHDGRVAIRRAPEGRHFGRVSCERSRRPDSPGPDASAVGSVPDDQAGPHERGHGRRIPAHATDRRRGGFGTGDRIIGDEACDGILLFDAFGGLGSARFLAALTFVHAATRRTSVVRGRSSVQCPPSTTSR
jgi:hypothetical protein